jgi:phenylacetate-coenzyme A ligase PaaK-like adenylate-forming protein
VSSSFTVGLQELRLKAAEFAQDRILRNDGLFRLALRGLREEQLLAEGRGRARLAAFRAWRFVPAYRRFLDKAGLASPDVPFERLPTMSKDSYVRAYPTEERCMGGSYLMPGVAIDESSGSTGQPFNWVRGIEERRRARFEMARLLGWALGKRTRIGINAFSMGAWATGVNVGEALELCGVVKSTGPDLEKILHTLEFFGPEPGYVICGYPPFMKRVLDGMRERGFPIAEYEMYAMVGGEGMSEELRRYLLQGFRGCYSGYGASDLELGMAFEMPECQRIRERLNEEPALREALLDGDHRLPMVFQYNPIAHYFETNERSELLVTLNHSRVLSPRIRYNIGDEARLMTRKQLLDQMAVHGARIDMPRDRTPSLPYLLLFGRRDQTISIMGANIYAEDVERAVYAQPELVGFVSFILSVTEHTDRSVRPRLAIEWHHHELPSLPLEILAERIGLELARINADFRQSLEEDREALRFIVEVHALGQGPFADSGRRIKNRYLDRPGS